MCNILARRYRLDGMIDKAITVAQEAIDIGHKLRDPFIVTINRVGLGNALREKGDFEAALQSYNTCSREAQALGRRETEGLASRLAAGTLVQMAEAGAPYQRPQRFCDAEMFATHSIGLLRGSIADNQVPDALETRGDARLGLGRSVEAQSDYAEAVRLFAERDEDGAPRLTRRLVSMIDVTKPRESMKTLLAA
jgi:tetratricopeptide (TPR) repeat protein